MAAVGDHQSHVTDNGDLALPTEELLARLFAELLYEIEVVVGACHSQEFAIYHDGH